MTINDKFYEELLANPEEYEKIQILADMYSKLSTTRVLELVKNVPGSCAYETIFVKEFQKSPGEPIFVLDIFCDNPNYSFLYLFTRNSIPGSLESIRNWLQEAGLFTQDFKLTSLLNRKDAKRHRDYLRWCRKFKFPLEESLLHDFTQKVIDLFNSKCTQ